MKEHWRPLPGFIGVYEVSDVGRVRRLYRSQRKGNAATRILSPAANKSGHLFVYLGRGNKRYLHRLVLEAFRGPCPKGKEARHRNGVASHNRLRNLIWGTRAQNLNDDYTHDPSRAKKVSLRMRKQWADPEYKARLRRSLLRAWRKRKQA